ncbi:S-adenosyl-L-methionine-dependent methyltransferase [Lasiosphaeris hirsuta]|uniref:S-adenosyl-L-methionine-dependent methyltransferase n=1 Tax=Lasiosphaeris hirsuta TaxID=260670 RepID=A0AA40E5U1_9PEZI|nr:S-adenosyl-L-methionine-dependent methyltransferase [Lasiosphaeris hirsuta]
MDPTSEPTDGTSFSSGEVLRTETQSPIPATSDGDSAYDEWQSTSSSRTRPLSFSALNYPIEHGRRYHAFQAGSEYPFFHANCFFFFSIGAALTLLVAWFLAYMLPNDEVEMDRLDLMHELLVTVIGSQLFLAPVDGQKMHRALDLGTGTGIWAIELADKFPNIQVTGNDLSPIQPHWIPPNLKFEVDDIESPWSHTLPFDFIFGRYLITAIKDFPGLVKSAYENIVPGGWVEFQDFDLNLYCDDGTLPADASSLAWDKYIVEATGRIGTEPSPGPRLEACIRAAGFRNVTKRQFKIPLGAWPKDLALRQVGALYLTQMLEGLEGFSLRLMCDVLGWKDDEVRELLAKVRAEFVSGRHHIYMDYYVVYGQK